jgi:multidrug resistance efflux pump
MGLFMRRRRPAMRLAAGAATAGVAYNAGKRHAEGEAGDEAQPAAAPAPAPAAADSTAELERLAQLHQSGALSDEEFAAAKAKVLGT